MTAPAARTEQVTRIGTPVRERRGFRLGVATWAGLVAIAAVAGGVTRLLQPDDEPAMAPAPSGERGLVRGDVDDDRRADLVVSTTDEIRAFLSTGTGFRASTFETEPAEDALRGDVDGDGRADLLTVVPAEDSLDVVLRRAARTGFEAPTRFRVEGIGRGDRLVLGDVDGDGDEDLVGAGDEGAYVARAGKGTFGAVTRWSGGLDLHDDAVVLAGMFTDDARADLLVVDGVGTGVELEVLPSDGRSFGRAELWRDIPTWILGAMKVVVGDFDGDGRTDLAEAGRPDGGGTDVMVLRSRGVDFGPPRQWLLDPALDWGGVRAIAGDYDGDGVADLALLQPGSDGATDVVVRASTRAGFGAAGIWLTRTWPAGPRPVGIGAGELGIR